MNLSAVAKTLSAGLILLTLPFTASANLISNPSFEADAPGTVYDVGPPFVTTGTWRAVAGPPLPPAPPSPPPAASAAWR